MRVDLQPERIELPAPVQTPVGPIDSVWSIAVTVGDHERRGTAQIHCQTERTAARIVAAAEEVVDACDLAEQAVDGRTWPWWRGNLAGERATHAAGADRRDA